MSDERSESQFPLNEGGEHEAYAAIGAQQRTPRAHYTHAICELVHAHTLHALLLIERIT
jgi:hypothetical protein